MSLFALPLSISTQLSTSRLHLHPSRSLPTQKRKRRRSSSPPSFEPYGHDVGNLHAASTNPLSLTPDEISQYRLAGLSLDEELPDRNGVSDWPHRGLARESTPPTPKGEAEDIRSNRGAIYETQDESDKEESKTRHKISTEPRAPRGHMLRIQHLGVLTAILHRNLLDGDIPRATRAYSLLLRTEVGGKPLDLKSTGYWAIGAELLVRSLDRKTKYSTFHHTLHPDSGSESDEEIPQEGETASDEADIVDGKKRWGSAAGLSKAKTFYETLILEYPYYKQYHDYLSSLDIWPVMAACEIYGIQYEQRAALQSVKSSSTSGYSSHEESASDSDAYATSEDDYSHSKKKHSHRRHNRRRRKIIEQMWTEKDNIRFKALTATESLAARMDEVLGRMPFDGSHDMLRLRGMIALYIGDLSVPEIPESLDGDEDGKREQISSDDDFMKKELRAENMLDRRKRERENRDRRLSYRDRVDAHERGKQRRRGEWARAKTLFEASEGVGGEAVDFRVSEESEDGDTDREEGKEEVDNLYDADD